MQKYFYSKDYLVYSYRHKQTNKPLMVTVHIQDLIVENKEKEQLLKNIDLLQKKNPKTKDKFVKLKSSEKLGKLGLSIDIDREII